jgi:hypothetical protein
MGSIVGFGKFGLRPAILKQWIPEWIKTDQIIFHPTVPVHFW